MPGYRGARLLQVITLCIGVIFASARTLPAQQRMEQFLAAPVSPSAVFNGQVVVHPTGAVLDFAVIIRGPVGWYNTRTSYSLDRPDSLPPGVYAQSWTVGARTYRLRFDETTRSIELFGRRLSLEQSNLVLVTLGPLPTDTIEVRLGERITVPVAEGVPVSRALLAASSQVREFVAGTPHHPAPPLP